MMIKKLLSYTFSASLFFGSVGIQAAPVELDKVAAVVNKDVIMQSQVEALSAEVKRQYQAQQQPLPKASVLNKQVLEKLIQDSLQIQIAEQLGMKISDAQLEQTILNIAKDKNQTLPELQADLASQGVSYAEFRHSVREELLIAEVSRIQVRRRINISEQEVDNLLKMVHAQDGKELEYRIGHIMLKLNEDASAKEIEQVTNKAENVLTRLKSGADFSELALAESQGPKALDGGDWGWMNINDMPTLFAKAVEGAKAKDIIGPLKSSNGLHIIKVLETKGQTKITSTEVNARHILIKPSIILSDEKAKQLLDKYRKQIIAGQADFSELAKAHSEDPGSAVKGGDLGWANPEMYVPAFKDEVLRLDMRELSQPFRSVHGWHLVQVMGKRSTDITEQANKQKAYQVLFNRRFSEESQNWLNEIREEAYVKIMDEE
ncbi:MULTISPECIES: peptidylprolyl isomerase SurA [unclassified Motilimonas]|uniref:peptidylprolyl isomerase SurA n=1 Tax=Motilimonas TaxID=1914248 RepID=UPI001E50E583|nr:MULTISPECIES: peptidylprolyl isomerase SurA [unclassified Motilimonas]MDO6527749.1 peptidylprolyl isomerase SurA [Motilimonas sp. 1_MG-2023]